MTSQRFGKSLRQRIATVMRRGMKEPPERCKSSQQVVERSVPFDLSVVDAAEARNLADNLDEWSVSSEAVKVA